MVTPLCYVRNVRKMFDGWEVTITPLQILRALKNEIKNTRNLFRKHVWYILPNWINKISFAFQKSGRWSKAFDRVYHMPTLKKYITLVIFEKSMIASELYFSCYTDTVHWFLFSERGPTNPHLDKKFPDLQAMDNYVISIRGLDFYQSIKNFLSKRDLL